MSGSFCMDMSVSAACDPVSSVSPTIAAASSGYLSLCGWTRTARLSRSIIIWAVLPLDLDLSQYFGQNIGMTCEGHRILIRRLGP